MPRVLQIRRVCKCASPSTPSAPLSHLPETISSRRRRGDEVKNYSPWLSEMEQSVGWSRLVCSRQWRVKEITPSLCQQPWPCTHKNIMRKDMLGLQGRKKKKKRGRPKFGAFFAGSDRRQTAFCMLFDKPRSMSKTVAICRARRGGSWVSTCHFLAPVSCKHR